MRRNADPPPISELCYVEASKVGSPAGVLSELNLLAADGQCLGSIEGVVIEAAARRVRYYDVRALGQVCGRRILLEADQLAQIEPERKALRLRADSEMEEVRGLDAATLRHVPEDQLLATLFPPRAA